ncbi:MAG: hypothetical protein IPG51_14365 [Chloroflexi bacterium]|nr:hypothetical protein [Chloroflexota bacterium]
MILDTTGAERLQARATWHSKAQTWPLRPVWQGCYVGDKELGGIIAYWQRVPV